MLYWKPILVKNRKGLYNKTCDRCRIRCIRFKCTICDYTCSDNNSLKIHIKMVHNKIKDVKCPHCDFECSTNGNLKQHIKIVHDKIKIKCLLCEYKCSTNSTLKDHIKQIHTKIKDFECGLCNYKCSTNSTLSQHIKMVHDKIKDFKCPTCDFKCSKNSDLKKHIKQVHARIKDFKCPTCDYACSANGSLTKHIKTCVGNEVGSSGEVKIKKVLNEMKIDYQYDTSHEVKNENNNYLRWDFIITDYDEPIFIEFDGKQHFEPVKFGGISKEKANEAFEKQKKHDKLKDDYCNDNGYLLLRIPYTEYANIEAIITEFMTTNTNWGYE